MTLEMINNVIQDSSNLAVDLILSYLKTLSDTELDKINRFTVNDEVYKYINATCCVLCISRPKIGNNEYVEKIYFNLPNLFTLTNDDK